MAAARAIADELGVPPSHYIEESFAAVIGGGIRQRETDAGLFLLCCSKPLSDLVIDR